MILGEWAAYGVHREVFWPALGKENTQVGLWVNPSLSQGNPPHPKLSGSAFTSFTFGESAAKSV